MIGIYITIVVVVAVLAVAAGTVARARSRRRRGGGPIEAPPRPTGQAPPAPTPEAPPRTAPAPAPTAERAPPAEPEVEPVVSPPEPAAAPPSYRSRLGSVRGLFSGAVAALRSGRIDAATWDSLEEALIRADVGVATADALLEDLRGKVETKEINGGDDLLEALGTSICQLLETSGARSLRFDGTTGAPDVWLIVGVNGVGKTTTIGKLARRESSAGRSVLLAAGDTFRAAAADQLALWAERTGTEIVRGAEGGDPERDRLRRRPASGGPG